MEVVINGCIVEINELPDIISFKNKTYQEIVNLKEELKVNFFCMVTISR